jgi:phosphoadenosine phosphosulfate reductase
MRSCSTSPGTTAPGFDVFFLDTGYHFAETIGTRDAYEVMLPLRIRTVHPRESVAQPGHPVR